MATREKHFLDTTVWKIMDVCDEAYHDSDMMKVPNRKLLHNKIIDILSAKVPNIQGSETICAEKIVDLLRDTRHDTTFTYQQQVIAVSILMAGCRVTKENEDTDEQT